MLIFIDESGGFQPVKRIPAVSCVAAVVVPESIAPTLFRRFKKLLRSFQIADEEVKGSKLTEHQMAAAIGLLRRFDVLVFAACVDLGLQSVAGIEKHKVGQAEIFRSRAGSMKFPTMREYLESLADRTNQTSNQLWLQATVLTKLVNRALRDSTLYYVQRLPQTLGRFTWRVDAKDTKPTDYEKLWGELVLPFLQTESLTDPFIQLDEGDYSALKKFELSVPEIPAYLRPAMPEHQGRFDSLDLNEVLRDLRFVRSDRLVGLQIVDIVASAIRRACNGTLQRNGWKHVGRLIPSVPRGRGKSIQFLGLGDEHLGGPVPHPSYAFVEECNRDARDILTRHTRRP